MQIDNELTGGKLFADRYYKGLLRGGLTVVREEGLPGLYKGWVTFMGFYLLDVPSTPQSYSALQC